MQRQGIGALIAGAVFAVLFAGNAVARDPGYIDEAGEWVRGVLPPDLGGPRAGALSRVNPVPRQDIAYNGPYAPNTIVVNTVERRLYYVYAAGRATKYGVGVGREGFEWSGTNTVSRKAEWPGWTPPPAMRRRQPDLPAYMPGGENNPLGARALYIGSTIYRIHGTNQPWTIGQAMSSGCIRMMNEDVIDLYDRVTVGTRVVVLR